VVLSFFSSAIETAFSTAHTDRRIQQALEKEAGAIAERYNQFDEIVRSGVSIEQFDAGQKKSLAKLERDNRIFKRKRASLEEASRSVFVGTFASLSVFLNIALAASLPYALVKSPTVVKPIGFKVITSLTFTENGIGVVWSQLDMSGQKMLVFFASAFPILVFGKVLPKEIGALFNHFFAYRMNKVARGLVNVFGFIPKALKWPLEALRGHVAKRRSA
jgi:CBS domain containing-hemolysin-like protein